MILGLDLSSSCTGYGVLEEDGKVIEYGQIRPTKIEGHGAKYLHISEKVENLLNKYTIYTVVLERYFVGGFKSQGTFICAELRGHIKAMLSTYPKIEVKEVFPSSLKKVVTGNGRASKREVCESILEKLGIKYDEILGDKKLGKKCRFVVNGVKYYDDVSDALSLAYYHLTEGKGESNAK